MNRAALAFIGALATVGACGSKPDPKTAAVVAEKTASLEESRFACQAKAEKFLGTLNPILTCEQAGQFLTEWMRKDEDCVKVLGAGQFELQCDPDDQLDGGAS